MQKNRQLDDTSMVNAEMRFLARAGLFICVVAASCMFAYGSYNFIVGETTIGLLTYAFAMIASFTGWRCTKNIYQPFTISLGMVPIASAGLYAAIQTYGLAGGLWAYPTILAIYAVLKERHASIVSISYICAMAISIWQIEESENAVRFIISLLATMAYVGIFKRQLTSHQRQLEQAATTDPLTGLLNRSLLDRELAKALSQHKRKSQDIVMMIMDVDEFKKINDTYGHLAGDKVLRHIGNYLQSHFRPSDAIFRIGGEEFMIFLYDTDLKNAATIAGTMLNDIQSLDVHPDFRVTVSVGLAELNSNDDVHTWMTRADKNVYKAKEQGRNQVVSYSVIEIGSSAIR